MISFVASTVVGDKKQYLMFADYDVNFQTWRLSSEISGVESGVYNIPKRIFNHPVEGEKACGEDVRGFISNGTGCYFLLDEESRTMTFIEKSEVDKFVNF